MHVIEQSKRGGKRPGAGRPDEGHKRYSVTLTEENVKKARERESNISGLLDRLLTDWLKGAK